MGLAQQGINKMKIKIIAAKGKNGELGTVNKETGVYVLPNWVLPGDMKRVKELTENHFVLMGRRTWESLPPRFRPLPNRTNIILTRDKNYQVPEGVLLLNSEQDFLNFILLHQKLAQKDLWLFGGAEIYKNFMQYADEIYVTEVDGEFSDCNVFFPEIDLKSWQLVSKEDGYLPNGQNKKEPSHRFFNCVYIKGFNL